MQRFKNPAADRYADILARPAQDIAQLAPQVQLILDRIKAEGDAAVHDFTRRFDEVELTDLRVSDAEIAAAAGLLSDDLRTAIEQAKTNIGHFHSQQRWQMPTVETMPGVQCWHKKVGIEKVGLYIPGGTAPLFSSVLMLAIPARLAQCQEIVLCTPPRKDGSVHPAILYAAQLCGVTHVFRVGGAQAIGAMAYGTESIPAVYKIFGPGNPFVTVAKQLVMQHGLAIDMPAGPSEVLVIADGTADPSFVAADLLSQAEHGVDSQVVLVSLDEQLSDQVLTEIERQVSELPRAAIARQAMRSSILLDVNTREAALALSNAYAPEHLIIATDDAASWVDGIINAGSVFLGHYTPESVGDYASGTNHTLPTNGFARVYSGVSLDDFSKKISFQQLSPQGLRKLGPTVEVMAQAEELEAHRRAVSIRLAKMTDR